MIYKLDSVSFVSNLFRYKIAKTKTKKNGKTISEEGPKVSTETLWHPQTMSRDLTTTGIWMCLLI